MIVKDAFVVVHKNEKKCITERERLKELVFTMSLQSKVKKSRGGANCSQNGKNYEIQVAKVCKMLQSIYMEIPFHTQADTDLGGSTAGQDIYVNFKSEKDVGIECKHNSTEFMQMSILPYDEGRWRGGSRCKIPSASKDVFEEILNSNILSMAPPPFLERSIRFVEWESVKHLYKDQYVNVPIDTIARVYKSKGSHYVQISEHGLYHTGEDPCGFGVPYLAVEQRLRVRCKRHGKKDIDGHHIPSSVMVSLCPKLQTLPVSHFTLDEARAVSGGLICLLKDTPVVHPHKDAEKDLANHV